MKILLATSTITPNAGIPSYNRELCSLLGREHEMQLLVGESISEYQGYKKVFSTKAYNAFSYKAFVELLSSINSEKFDLIINSNSHEMAIMTPFINTNTKIVTVSHSLGTLDCDNAAFKSRYIDNIIALSDACGRYIDKKFNTGNVSKVKVVFNSVAENPNAHQLRLEKKSREPLSIVFAGGSSASKAPDIVVPVIQKLCETDLDFRFYWMGNSTPPLKKIQPYNDIRKVLPNDKRVIVTGRIPHEEADKLISTCNIFFAPSRREGFPMALLEALRVGCIPVVADFDIANKEIITDSLNGFVIPHNDINAFVNRFKDILLNHSVYEAIYENSYTLYTDRLSFEFWEKKMKDIISNLADNHQERLNNPSMLSYEIVKWQFKFLEKWDLIHNQLTEVLPVAIKFYKLYKK